MERVAYFGLVDYIVFVALFLVSLAIGIYFAVVDRKSPDPEQYLMGGRKLSLLPVALSITVSVVSTNTLLGAPAEVNRYIFYINFIFLSDNYKPSSSLSM